jgi:predicted O-methyltransferase YrrM
MNDKELWTHVDAYLTGQLVPPDPALAAALESSTAAGLPAINVAPNQGKMLELLARAIGARRILEIGTLGGYSTIWLAHALPPDGRLITLELDPKHAQVAQANLARAGFADRTEVRPGPALDSLAQLTAQNAGPFDFIFIDADKQTYPEYFAASLRLARPGTLIVADNVVRGGAVADPASLDASVQGVRRFYQAVAAEKRVSGTALQTVGNKGHDGFALLLVIDEL